MIGKLKKVALREIWEHEARNFTTWLSENIDVLNEALELKLAVTEKEKSVGPFSSDIVAEDDQGTVVVIENQLERTDHDHLGKIVTYLSNIGNAKMAIWISSNPVEEHRKAIEWLNEFTPKDVSFYLIKVEAVQIGDSMPAPLFSIIAQPTEFVKQVGRENAENAEKNVLRKKFWNIFYERARGKLRLSNEVPPSIYTWVGIGAGKSGFSYVLYITNKTGGTELYIDKGKDSQVANKRYFDKLYKYRQQIEKITGRLKWERLDKKRACRIRFDIPNMGLLNEDKWSELQDKMIDEQIKLENAFKPHIQNLK